jgi:uncharacterized protein YndB with AHSA1/START domain
MTPKTTEFSLTRVFNAPRAEVWKAFTEAGRLTQWWGPKGFTMEVAKLDLRPGGVFHYGMRSPAGHEMWGKFVYREIAPPERLVFVVSFTDAEGNIQRHPMSATWPLEVLNTMTLTEEDGKTTLHMSGVPINATEEEEKTFDAGRQSMQQGFKGTLDQLEEFLRKSELCGGGAVAGKQHEWLTRLAGEWTFEGVAEMGPGKDPAKAHGEESVRTLGEFWIVAEGRGEMARVGPANTILTLGYDPAKQRYVGTWIGSMMPTMFVYQGELDSSGKVLPLETEGPHMERQGETARYRDTITIESPDHRILTSEFQDDAGQWRRFMTVHYRRRTEPRV